MTAPQSSSAAVELRESIERIVFSGGTDERSLAGHIREIEVVDRLLSGPIAALQAEHEREIEILINDALPWNHAEYMEALNAWKASAEAAEAKVVELEAQLTEARGRGIASKEITPNANSDNSLPARLTPEEIAARGRVLADARARALLPKSETQNVG